MMAAASKMPFFDPQKAYNYAQETELGAVKSEIENAKVSKEYSSKMSERTMKDYLLDFVCDIGSSPYVAAALVRDEAILWLLEKLLKPDGSGLGQAQEVLSRLRGLTDCPGSRQLKPADLAAVNYLKLKIVHIAEEKKRNKGARGGANDSALSLLPEAAGVVEFQH